MKKSQSKKVLTKDANGKENGFLLELLKNQDGHTISYLTAASLGSFKGFHLHRRRISRYVCLKGAVRITGYEYVNGVWNREVVTLEPGDKLEIPINIATGIASVGGEEAWLVNFPEPAYNPSDKDEQVEYSLDELKKGTTK